MTKINKLGKSTFVIAILSFILVAVLSFGGTYAYFSAVSGRAAGSIKTGHLSLVATGDVVTQINNMIVANNTITQPGQRLVGDPGVGQDGNGSNLSVKVTTNIDYYIRVKFEVVVKPGRYSWSEQESKYVWTEANDKTHNGVTKPDNLLTPDVDDTETDDEVGEGDNVHDDISILDIALKVRDGAVTGTDPSVDGTAWKEYQWKEKTEDTAYQHTGYFYPATVAAARKSYTAAEGQPGVPVDYEYQMDVLINVQDWVGADGCTYYMDAGIEVRFQVEILQADYLDATKLAAAIKTLVGDDKLEALPGEDQCFFTGTLAGSDNPVPATIRQLHYGWNAAIGYDQSAGGFKDPANPST
jgi:predicted ribosomally synthesized peptide with SipW-like signal peptide